ncbi:MAG: hypothetical protein KJ927_09160, partial [Candidatus Eisenbacteria bacterium]|nr:hypothetical protein [Candidatus Eisenbacteria bacterium]
QERLKSQLDRRQIFTQPQIPEPDEILSAVATWERLAQESQAVLAQEEIEQRRAGRIRSSAKRMEVRRRILEGVGGSGAGVIVGWLIWFTNLVPPLVAVGLGLMVAFAITTILWRLPTSQQSLIEALTTALSGTQKRKGEIETKISEFKSRFEPLMKSLSLPSIDGGGLTALSKDFIEWRAAQQEYLTAELICRQAEIDLFGPLSKEEEPGSAGQTKTPEELPAPFPDLALLARSVGNIEFKNGSDLLYWLSQQEEENWRRWMDEAAEQAALHREIADLDDKQTRIKGDKTPGGLSFLEKELVDLNASCRPWALDVDIKAIEPRLRAVRQAEERQRRLLARKKELGNSIDNLKNDLNLVKLEWESWRMKLAPYLELAGGDPERLQQQLNDAQELHAQIRRAEQLRDQALAIQEGNNDDPESLKKNRDRLVEQWDFHHRAMRDLVKDSDALRVFEELEDAQQRDSYRQGLMDQLIELETHAKALESEFDDVRISLRSLKPEGSVHLAQAELEIRETRGELEHLEQRRDTILEAWRLMSDAVEELRRSFGPALAQEISRLFFLITQKDGRRIDLSPKLELEILENDQPCSSAQLSQGAGDQLTWSVRLALAQKIGGDIILPILMDDPFVNFDFERLTRAGDALSRLSQERQILIWTKDERLRAWGAPIRTELSPL